MIVQVDYETTEGLNPLLWAIDSGDTEVLLTGWAYAPCFYHRRVAPADDSPCCSALQTVSEVLAWGAVVSDQVGRIRGFSLMGQ